MKKIGLVLLCFVLMAGVMTIAAGCQDEPSADTEMCLVEVDGGTGGGYYYKDVNCTITAQVPEGKQFMKWIADGADKSANATYVFTVTKNIKLTAVFADDVEIKDICQVNVKFGSGSGNFYAGTQRVLSVADEYKNLTFTGWKATSKGASGEDVVETLSTANPYTLTVTKSMDIVAQFNNINLAKPNNASGEQFRIATNGAYEFDRYGAKADTMYVTGVDHVLYYVYESNAEDAQPVNSFFIKLLDSPVTIDGETMYAYMSTMDGALVQNLKGQLGDFYQDTDVGKANVRTIVGAESGKTYYFALMAVGADDSPFISSPLSAKGPGVVFTF